MEVLMRILMALMFLVNDPAVLKDFNDRIEQYADLQKKVEKSLDPIEQTGNAALLVAQKAQFAKAMQARRPQAAQGDFFTPGVKPVLLKIIQQQLAGPANAKPRSMVLGEGNPKAKEEPSPTQPRLKVNTAYPAAAPMSSVPPSLLLALPTLPESLEYRFVGRHLILRDAKSDLVVDFILNAAPTS
jgi:hypothetical protein